MLLQNDKIDLSDINKIKNIIHFETDKYYDNFYANFSLSNKLSLYNKQDGCFLYLNKQINYDLKLFNLDIINTKNTFINHIHNLHDIHIKIAYLILITKNIIFNSSTPIYDIFLLRNDNGLYYLESKSMHSQISIYDSFSEFIVSNKIYGDLWSDYNGIKDSKFDFNSFFYDNTAKLSNDITICNTLIIYGLYINEDDSIILRGNLINNNELINKKIII